ncbi:hypothetical protein SLEP1_g50676 [Rubroshorea leprosula]|uniref:DUF4283 domain-containing protein n=1 Tax=Rubroshorea leprosula TaxID=152421 RepID=A0AAV5M1Q0_9ROSI|nr:hypothetical protein SLEP1_g50676 [Rubroshorea leprosula]
MGGRGRPRKKDPPPKGGAATKIIDLKDDNGEQNSISVEETNKEQTEVVKLAACDPHQMGLEIEKSGRLSPDLGEKEGDDEGISLDLAVSTQGQRKSRSDAGSKDERADKGKNVVGPVEGKVAKGKKGVHSETQPFVIQMKQPSGEKDAGSTSGTGISPSARWSDLIEKEKGEFQPSLKQKPLRSWASVVEGNRDISKGWDLQYIKPQDPTSIVVITEDEWVKGSKIWENALVGYVLGSKPEFKDIANFMNNSNGDAKQAVLERRWTFNGHPLILKQWTPDFDLDNLDISKIPVWIQFPELHLSLWNPESLGKLASYVGVPIATDALTAKRQRVAYARMLVEMEIMDTLPRVVPIIGPKGERNEQSPMQLEVGAVKSMNLQSETSTGTGDKGMMQKAAGGESSVIGDVKFLCTIVYAFNTFDGRLTLWDQVRALDVENVPWIISGDFNTTLNYGERVKPSGVVWGDTSELKDFVSRMEVFDLQFSGAFFTWSNKQGENDRLWCKLDRVMANSSWVSAFPNTSVVFLNPQSSDHSPSLVTMDVLMNEKPRPFRFCNAWSKDENFLDLVREAWSVDVQGCPMFVVVQKLKLNALFDETLAAKEKEFQRELTKLERANLSVIAQRAKVTWLKEMDSNFAYFHAKVKERQHRSVINSILNSEGVRVNQPELIEQGFLMFYQNLFGKAKEGVQAVDMNVIRRGRVLTTKELEELCRPFTAKEVETALFSIPSNKSLGPDGFTSGFYRAA